MANKKGSIVAIAKSKGMTPSEMGRLGGLKGGKGNKGKKKFNLTKNKKCCLSGCAIYPCFAAPQSKKKFKGLCALYRLQDPQISQSTEDFLRNGEDGFNNQMMRILQELRPEVEITQDPKIKMGLLKEIRETKRSIWPPVEKSQIEHSGIEGIKIEFLDEVENRK